MKYTKEYNLVSEAVKNALSNLGNIIIKTKEHDDLVTSTDLFIETRLIEMIKENFSTDNILSEEFNNHHDLKERTWIIDPIDGTSNYASGLLIYCVQVALWENGSLVFSYINIPELNKEYYAVKGYGAFLNNNKITLKQNTNLSNALFSFIGNFRRGKKVPYELIDKAVDLNMKVRVLGSIGVEMALLAEGIISCLYSTITNIYDIAPGLLLCQEAGCFIRNEGKYILGESETFIFNNEKLSNLFK